MSRGDDQADPHGSAPSKRILFFFSLGFDTPSPSLHLMKAMVEDSLEAGWKVHVVATHTTGLYPDIPEQLRLNRRLTWDIIRLPVVPKASFARRYLSGIRYAFASLPRIRRVDDYDLVYVQSSPTALFNLLVARACGMRRPIIYSVQDMFPGSSIHSGVMTNPWMQRIFFLLQKIAYATADRITVISEDMRQRVIDEGVKSDAITTIVNWYDDQAVSEIPWDSNQFVRAFQLPKHKFYVQYAGTMGYVFDYSMVLRVAEILKNYADIELQMIGEGSQRATFEEQVRVRGLSNVQFYPLQPQELVGHVYSASSVCLIPLKKGIIGNSVPSKVALVMACNRTVVNSVDEDSEYYRMFHEFNIGVSASNDDPSAVARAILDLYTDGNKRKEMARNAFEFSRAEYSRSVNTPKLLALFANLILEHRQDA